MRDLRDAVASLLDVDLLPEVEDEEEEHGYDLFSGGPPEGFERVAQLLSSVGLSLEDLPRRYRSGWFVMRHIRDFHIPMALGWSKQGHGDVIWASAEFCADVLSELPGELKLPAWETCRVLELGSGVGLPSCCALRHGATVCASDLPNERLLALATSLRLNLKILEAAGRSAVARVKPHIWGQDAKKLCEEGDFHLILCNDCLYMPELHKDLLESIDTCLALTGSALICFSFHDTAPEAAILGFFELARGRGFQVRDLAERQLAPRCSNMALRRSYVYAKVLTRACACVLAEGRDRLGRDVWQRW